MTIAIAWLRKLKNTEELIVASDSRLRWGLAWDSCPKIFNSQRDDTVFAFAGDTMYAYPLILQALNHISLHRASRIRQLDIYDLKGHLKRVFNYMLSDLKDFPNKSTIFDSPETLFVMSGYSWRSRKFAIWKVRFDNNQKKFIWDIGRGLSAAGGENKLEVIAFPSMSDRVRRIKIKNNESIDFPRSQDIRIIALSRIAKLVKSRGGLAKRGLDMEPFEILRDMLRENFSPHIGGAPQIMKIYSSCNTITLGVLWPNKKSNIVYLNGRKLLPYERHDCTVLDPDTLKYGLHLWPKKD